LGIPSRQENGVVPAQYGACISPRKRARRRQPAAAVGLAVALGSFVALLGCGARVSAPATGARASTVDQPTLARLRSIARDLATHNGDAGAQGRNAVLTTRGVARRLLGERLGTAGPDRAVYVIWMYGNFGPRHDGRPIGYLLIGVLDASTTRLIHAGIIPGELNPGMPNPEKLGLPEIPLSGDVRAVTPDAASVDRMREIARRAARGAGEPAPTADYYLTNEQDAERALGNSANGNPDEPAYVIVMHGRFEQNHSVPAGVTGGPPAPFLVLTLRAADLSVSTVAWANVAPPTDSLGSPMRLLG
jgi:hypothetical protein